MIDKAKRKKPQDMPRFANIREPEPDGWGAGGVVFVLASALIVTCIGGAMLAEFLWTAAIERELRTIMGEP